MKLNDRTITILKNFAAINPGIVLMPGFNQRTVSEGKSIFAEATLDDEFPIEFGIHDLNQFIANVETLDKPDLSFNNEYVIMDDGKFKLQYKKAMSELITAPKKNPVLKNIDVFFELTNAEVSKVLRLANMNKLNALSIIGKDEDMLLTAHNSTNSRDSNQTLSNEVTTKLGPYKGSPFVATFKTAYLKMIPDLYRVEIDVQSHAKFTSLTQSLSYSIALDVTPKK